MVRHRFLHRKHGRSEGGRTISRPTLAMVLKLLEDRVVARFTRLSMSDLRVVELAVSEPDEEEPLANPSHPACTEVSGSDYCRESWQLHLARLKCRPETHWGVCRHARRCAIVPIVSGRRCLAVVKLVGAASVDPAEFQRLTEILELLVRDFTCSYAGLLSRVPGGLIVEGTPGVPSAVDDSPAQVSPSTHPQIVRALAYVDEHLSDPGLTVARVASVLNLSATYLSELFVEQVGQRMSRLIANRRIELAKRLLVTTDWQIKRVAHETGHANPNWFCHVFSVHVGLTPGEYRATATAQKLCTADRE